MSAKQVIPLKVYFWRAGNSKVSFQITDETFPSSPCIGETDGDSVAL